MFYHAQSPAFGWDGPFDAWCKVWVAGLVESGSWFEHTKLWRHAARSDEGILWVHYEDMHSRTEQVVQEVAAFIGVDADSALVQALLMHAYADAPSIDGWVAAE